MLDSLRNQHPAGGKRLIVGAIFERYERLQEGAEDRRLDAAQ